MASRLGAMFGTDGAGTFLGLPACDLDDGIPAGTAAVLMGADTATPYASVGAYCAGGAAAIRAGAADFAANRDHLNVDLGGPTVPRHGAVVDAGDLAIDVEDAEAARRTVREAVARCLGAGAVPIVLGGDDSLPIPVLEGFGAAGRRVSVVQIDAHLDWRDEVGGERLGLSSPMRRASEMAHVSGLVQIGQRGIGSARPGDMADAEAAGAVIVPMRAVVRGGAQGALGTLPEDTGIVLCFDWDAMDPAVMPAVIARMPGGMDFWTAVGLIEAVAATGRLAGVVFAEFMAERDIDGLGARLAAQVVTTAVGLVARAADGVYQAPAIR